MADRAKAVGAKPEIEVFDLGHIELAKRLIADGHIAEPPLFQICLGISYGAPATPETLIQMRDRLPKNAAWSAFGIGRTEFPMAAVAVAAGGNVRVGLEDNLYLGRGQLAPSNAGARRARRHHRRAARRLGREPGRGAKDLRARLTPCGTRSVMMKVLHHHDGATLEIAGEIRSVMMAMRRPLRRGQGGTRRAGGSAPARRGAAPRSDE
jgi:uncharacterized protein (DUF849 family)